MIYNKINTLRFEWGIVQLAKYIWSDTMQIKQFEYIQEIARQGSVKQAAEKLYISQQALSESVRSLEKELEFQIFSRTNKGIIVTEKGEKFLADLELIMPIVYGWNEYKDKPQIKLLVQYALSDLLIDTRFVRYLAKEKQLELQSETLNLNGVLEAVAKNTLCLSIITIRENSNYSYMLSRFRKEGRYVFDELVEQEKSQMCILMHADCSMKKTGQFIDLQELKGKTLVVNKDQIKLNLVKQITEHTGKTVYGLPYTVKPIDIVVQNQNAITFIPKFIADENFYVKNGLLVSCPILQCKQDEWRVYLMYDKQWSERLKVIAEEMKNIFSF